MNLGGLREVLFTSGGRIRKAKRSAALYRTSHSNPWRRTSHRNRKCSWIDPKKILRLPALRGHFVLRRPFPRHLTSKNENLQPPLSGQKQTRRLLTACWKS